MTDIERAAEAALAAGDKCRGKGMSPREGCTVIATAVIESVLLEPSEEVVRAATNAIIAGDRFQVQGSGLEPSTEALRPVYRDFARAALIAAALKILGRVDG